MPNLTLNIRSRLILLLGALLTLVGVAGYIIVQDSQQRLIESQAVRVAEIVTRQAAAAHSIYSNNILGKIEKDKIGFADVNFHKKKGALPIPAQFMKSLALRSSGTSDGLYKYRLVSKWNLAEDQNLNNDFLIEAWKHLEQQDQLEPTQAIQWTPFYSIREFNGEKTLLFLSADPASKKSCITCHNNYEQYPAMVERRSEQGVAPQKEWKLHQLMGATFVQIPIQSMQTLASKESTQTMLWILVILTGGLALLALFLLGDFTKARRVTKELYWQARHDDLTKLPNRLSFNKKAEDLLQSAHKENKTHAMFYMDLDQFKVVNDTCGHASGDVLLCQITKELQLDIEASHMLARLGGDEFGVLLENVSIQQAEEIAKTLCANIKNYLYTCKGRTFNVGVSIGVVAINKDSKSVDDALRQADLSCYAAKEAGRNRVHLYLEADEEMVLRKGEMTWVSRILKALKEDRILIYSQKITALNTKETHIHREVLVRLLDEDGRIVSPGEFLPAAERYDLMSKLDLAILDLSLSALHKRAFSDLGDDGFISVNISGQSFSNESFLTEVLALIKHHDVDTNQLCFELTESTAISNPIFVRHFMAEMKKLGIKFALDDFGTGLSSLTYLKQFPVDYLKIDGSFIKDIVQDPIDRTLVEAINQMAHTMKIQTIAEYVESEEILELLHEMKVDYAQGYYIERPNQVIV
ncbi:EAL domain-containing protein [Leucothrix arctica]|uniref:Diguanylate cyclase n=1 Tax=Leucothrix arctica TaxID=1481894 RepID=A0A317CLU2_9GAMM|nr:EAL domain-containing protein [Leucothrix arctica]PWQ98413.1 hypothetical protein DKT75_04630 [Leucothrix arctica]